MAAVLSGKAELEEPHMLILACLAIALTDGTGDQDDRQRTNI
jgi:hypothetical protein